MCYGRGSETLLRALDNGELGAIAITTCGEFRGSTHQSSFLLLISGYCKSRQQNVTFVQDWEIRLYLSALPVSNAWVRALFSPFLDENIMPFSLLSYELVHPRLRIWRSVVGPMPVVPIKGVIGRYQIDSGDYVAIGAAIADTHGSIHNSIRQKLCGKVVVPTRTAPLWKRKLRILIIKEE
jgi:hypothetical protein